MKTTLKILCLILAAALCLVMTGCQSGESKPAADKEPQADGGAESFEGQVLNVYNWGEYIDKQVIYDFEKQYKVRVNYTTYASNEELYTKLMSKVSYDVIIPSDYMIERLIRENMLQKIDKSIVTNLDQLADSVKGLDFDPDNTWSVPYLWQTVGIVYDTTKIDPAKVEEKGWEIFRNPEYDSHVYMYDSERDAFMIAFKALGYSMNTENQEEIEAARDWLRGLDKAVHPAYVTDEVIDSMANGKKWLALVYSGDAAYILSENENMGFCNPAEGTNLAVDAMVIPANAANPKLANIFINYVLEYENSKRISEEVGYASSNARVLEELSSEGGAYYENAAYLPRYGYDKDEMLHDNETLRRQLSEMWLKVKLHE
ncbi:MAG: ABC transporter substrate-binding protein [Clostridiales bacterium]|nr:ABC transporter substrate-binding protein [Clostridiales bacterium]